MSVWPVLLWLQVCRSYAIVGVTVWVTAKVAVGIAPHGFADYDAVNAVAVV